MDTTRHCSCFHIGSGLSNRHDEALQLLSCSSYAGSQRSVVQRTICPYLWAWSVSRHFAPGGPVTTRYMPHLGSRQFQSVIAFVHSASQQLMPIWRRIMITLVPCDQFFLGDTLLGELCLHLHIEPARQCFEWGAGHLYNVRCLATQDAQWIPWLSFQLSLHELP